MKTYTPKPELLSWEIVNVISILTKTLRTLQAARSWRPHLSTVGKRECVIRDEKVKEKLPVRNNFAKFLSKKVNFKFHWNTKHTPTDLD